MDMENSCQTPRLRRGGQENPAQTQPVEVTTVIGGMATRLRSRKKLLIGGSIDAFRDEISCDTIVYGILQSMDLAPGEHSIEITQNS